jgi:hypothetical protein
MDVGVILIGTGGTTVALIFVVEDAIPIVIG